MNKRNYLQTILFMLNQCLEAFLVLEYMQKIQHEYLGNIKNTKKPIDIEITGPALSVARDSFCVRLACLFDNIAKKRKDTLSLEKFYKGNEIIELRNNSITQKAIKARNKNICHVDINFTQWPEIDEILESKLNDKIERIKNGIIFYTR